MYSMTGFGSGEAAGESFQLTVEIKTVNHRFRDIRFKMGSVFTQKEIQLRKKIEKHFKRGSFDITIYYKKSENAKSFDDLDEKKILEYLEYIKGISSKAGMEVQVRPGEFLRSEFMIDRSEEKEEELNKLLEIAFDGAIEQLKASRKNEGDSLKNILVNHLDEYENLFKSIEGKTKDFEAGVREKLDKKLKEYGEVLDKNDTRLGLEIIYYLEKLDIHEEINRIHSHLDKMRNLISSESEVGRKLEFTLQELNRETNTIGSKSNEESISSAVINMKGQLEKIREQALNVE